MKFQLNIKLEVSITRSIVAVLRVFKINFYKGVLNFLLGLRTVFTHSPVNRLSLHCFLKSFFKALRIEEAVDQKDGRTPEIRLVLNSCAEIKNNDGTYIIPIQLYFHLLNKLQ